MGLFFGGLETLEMAMYHFEDFDYICPLSSGWWISEEWTKRGIDMDNREVRAYRLYFLLEAL
jgi:hypothetical protein